MKRLITTCAVVAAFAAGTAPAAHATYGTGKAPATYGTGSHRDTYGTGKARSAVLRHRLRGLRALRTRS